MGRHKNALEMARKAINVLSKVSIPNITPRSSRSNLHDSTESLPKSRQDQKTFYLMTVVAYYNMGVEYEYLNQLNEAIHSINEASTVAKLHLGKEHYLTYKIQESKSKIHQKKKANNRLNSLRTGGRMKKITTPYSNSQRKGLKSYLAQNRQKI